MRKHYLDNPHLAAQRANLFRAIDEGRPLSLVTALYIQFILASFSGNKVHAAAALDIDRRTIQRHAKRGDLCEKKTSYSSTSVTPAIVNTTHGLTTSLPSYSENTRPDISVREN